jgi:hypothetical protein
MRHRVRLLAGLVVHAPLALAAVEPGHAPAPGLLEFLGTFEERDQGDDWFEFLERMRPPGAHTDATGQPDPSTDDADEPKTGT